MRVVWRAKIGRSWILEVEIELHSEDYSWSMMREEYEGASWRAIRIFQHHLAASGNKDRSDRQRIKLEHVGVRVRGSKNSIGIGGPRGATPRIRLPIAPKR